MEKVPQENSRQEQSSTEILALIMIGIGLVWILKQTGLFNRLPFSNFDGIFGPIRNVFHGFGHHLFSLPVILILIGVVLMAGRRTGGWILVIIGGILLLPKLIVISGATIIFLFPILLIALGIGLIARLL